MASNIHTLSLTLCFTLLFFPNPTFPAQVPQSSPSPSPQLPPQANSPSPASPAPSPAFPNSPPAPPPSQNSPTPAPSPADDGGHKKSPSPAPDAPADGVGHENQTHLGDLPEEDDSGGMSGGKRFGIAIGVIFGGCAVGLAAVVYRKRQRNIRRANYSYTDRRDFL